MATQLERLSSAVEGLSSSDPKIVAKNLSVISARSADGFELPHLVDLVPKIVQAIGELMDIVNPLATRLCATVGDEQYYHLILSTPKYQEELPEFVCSAEFKFMGRYVDDNPILLTCLTILRNMSFETASEPLIAFSTPIMRQLVALVCLATVMNTMSETTFLAFEILTRLAYRIDFYGKRRSQFAQQLLESPLAAKSSKLHLSDSFSASSTIQYILSARTLMPALCHILRHPSQRPGAVPDRSLSRAAGLREGGSLQRCRALVVAALELLSRLANNPDNSACLLSCPIPLMRGLVQLLIVNNTRGDAIVTEVHAAQGDPFGRFRPPAAVLLPRPSKPPTTVLNYSLGNVFANDYIDSEIRDLSLDLLGVLCRLSRENQLTLVPDAVPFLLRIAQAVNADTSSSSKTESSQKAVQLLQLLVYLPESDQEFRAHKTELMLAAFRDDALAELVLNKHHPAFVSLVDNDLHGPDIDPISLAAAPATLVDAGSSMMI